MTLADSNGEVIIYTGDDGKPRVQARLQDENMWLTQAQLVEVFNRVRQILVSILVIF